MKWLDKIKPTKGDAYIKGNALPESDYETATGRALYTITALRKAYDAGFAEGCGSTGFNLCVDGVHVQALSDAIDAAIKEAVAAERERCAVRAGKQARWIGYNVHADAIVEAIRKGEQE